MKFKSFNLVKICLMMKIKVLLKNIVLKFYFASIISAAQHLYEKREGSGSKVPLTNRSGSGRSKTYGSGSATLPPREPYSTAATPKMSDCLFSRLTSGVESTRSELLQVLPQCRFYHKIVVVAKI
jgi:hypothetical protein